MSAALRTKPKPRWLLCRARRPDAALRMYCFPHSGGSAGEYLRWSDHLPSTEVWGVQLPGRGSRTAEPGLTSMPSLVKAIVAGVEFAEPYVLFGHSLGALAAYETALELRKHGRPGPAALILSAYEAPRLHSPGEPLHELDGPSLLEALNEEHGSVPAEVRADPELCEAMVAGLRADLTVVATYRPTAAEPLSCPILILGGQDDHGIQPPLEAWSDYTTADFGLRMFPGDHFYFRERPDDVFEHLNTQLEWVAQRSLSRESALGSDRVVPRAVDH